MARYYTLCETTPGKSLGSSRRGNSSYLRVYHPSTEGFLFHDTENTLTFTDIQKSLWMLSTLFEGARKVIAVSVDANTIMATFNTVALPRPVRPPSSRYSTVKPEEYLESSGLSGWLLPDIKDPACEPIAVDYNDLYNDCIMLERVTDCCPCVKQAEGTCLPSTVFVKHPWLAENATNYTETDSDTLRRERFRAVAGFEYISGQLATSADFMEAVRPWDNYDFSLVGKRKATFAARGQNISHRSAHRKIECSQCVFGAKKYGGGIADCGRINNCTTHSTEEQAWAVLFDWLRRDSYLCDGTPGFTPREIDYLIKESGRMENSKSISDTRKVPTYLAGFDSGYGGSDLRYKVSAARGNLTRHKYYDSYEQLRIDYPMLPASTDIPDVVLEPKMRLAHAIFAGMRYISGRSGSWGHNTHPVWRIELQHGTMSSYGCNTSGSLYGPTLSLSSAVDKYVHVKWPGQQYTIPEKYAELVVR